MDIEDSVNIINNHLSLLSFLCHIGQEVVHIEIVVVVIVIVVIVVVVVVIVVDVNGHIDSCNQFKILTFSNF